MASSGEEGILTEDNVLPQDPAEVAEQIAGSDKLPTETAAASLREDQITNAINFLSHPKVNSYRLSAQKDKSLKCFRCWPCMQCNIKEISC